MKIAVILFGIFVFLTSTIFAASGLSSGLDIIGSEAEFIELVSSCEKLKLDIVGSVADDILIVSPDASSEDIEIVGGTAKNIKISSKNMQEKAPCCHHEMYIPIYYPEPVYQPKCAYESHLGVDAWNGCYWYASSPYLPKWPEVF
jgi:hypothetical protein